MPYKDPHAHKEVRSRVQAAYRARLREEVLSMYGGKCTRCGFSDPRALQIDHIAGGGLKERKEFGSGPGIWRRVKANPEKYQLLCANCNWIKRYENSENRQPAQKRAA